MASTPPFFKLALRRLSPRLISHHTGADRDTRLLRQTRLYSTAKSMPKIVQPSFWNSLVPKFLRNRTAKKNDSITRESKEWNPASYYIIIFILIGSQAIRMLTLKHDFAAYTRSTDNKINLLREVIEKIHRGENVDVRKILGTGNETKEREWDQVLRDLEEERSIWHKNGEDSIPETRSPQEQVRLSQESPRMEDSTVSVSSAGDKTRAQPTIQNGRDVAPESKFL